MTHKVTIKYDQGGVSGIGRRLLTEIIFLRNKYSISNGFIFDHIYISIILIDFLREMDSYENKKISDTIQLVGTLNGMQVFVDLEMNRNQIKLSIDKSRIREIKINSIIDQLPTKDFEAIIEVESDLI